MCIEPSNKIVTFSPKIVTFYPFSLYCCLHSDALVMP